MNDKVSDFLLNGYLITESVPLSYLMELKETLINLVKRSYSKNIGTIRIGDYEENNLINQLFIELENKNHSYITKIYDSIRLTTSYFNVVNSKEHIDYCKKLLQVEKDADLFINSMSIRMDPPSSKTFSYGWHTDADVNIKKSDFVQSWIPLGNINKELGGLEIIEKSHIKEFKTEYTDRIREAVNKGNRLKDPIVYRTPHDTKIITPEYVQKILTPIFGQTIFFSNKLMHRSGINKSKDKVRLAVTAFYHRSDKSESDWY